ncbi:MAG: hypothetical protein ACREJO_16990 [Phycisphaerales bacterium]
MDVPPQDRALIVREPIDPTRTPDLIKAEFLQWAQEADAAKTAALARPLPLIAGFVAGMVAGSVTAKALAPRPRTASSSRDQRSIVWPMLTKAAIWAAPIIVRHAIAARNGHTVHENGRQH